MAGAEPELAGRRFSLLRILGEGSFGTVYLAEMEGAGGFRKRVALKLLNQTWEPGSDAARRLRDEARLLGRLEHRNIVRVDDLVLLEGRWGLVMEYVSGADMERVFTWCEATNTRLSPRAVAELGAAVAQALDAAWSALGEDGKPLHVVHRDIKPSNVRLADNGAVKVLDFGVARAAFTGREARTERVRYGSLGYMAPERLLGEPDAPAGDVYALGVMLYELVTCKLFGRAELGVERQAAQVQEAHDVLVGAIGDNALVTMIESMLAYAPDARPTASELGGLLQLTADTLEGADLAQAAKAILPQLPPASSTDAVRGKVLQESGSRTESGARVSSATLVVDPSFDADKPTDPPAAPPARRSPVPAVLGGVALLALLVVGGFFVTSWSTPDAATEPTITAPPAATLAVAAAPAEAPAGAGGVAPVPAPVEPPAEAPSEAKAVAGRAPKAPKAPSEAPKLPSEASKAPAAKAPPEAAAAPDPAPSGQRLRAAKFTLTGAEGISVTCGDVSGTGTTSTLLRGFPAGECLVAAAGRTARVRLEEPRGVACAVEGDSLTCR